MRDGGRLVVLEAAVSSARRRDRVLGAGARDVKNEPGRPKTGKLDAVCLAKLAQRGMLRPSFVPPPWQRQLRDLCRYWRTLISERTRESSGRRSCWKAPC